MPAEKEYRVRVWYDTPVVRDAGQTFGPFATRAAAEACLIALSGRNDVKSGAIEEVI